jgi:hypothetical protein
MNSEDTHNHSLAYTCTYFLDVLNNTKLNNKYPKHIKQHNKSVRMCVMIHLSTTIPILKYIILHHTQHRRFNYPTSRHIPTHSLTLYISRWISNMHMHRLLSLNMTLPSLAANNPDQLGPIIIDLCLRLLLRLFNLSLILLLLLLLLV